MNVDALTTLVAGGESETIEFKRSTGQLREGMRTVCGMLNGRLPGFVLFGVGNNGRIFGQDVTTRTLEEIANELRCIEPPAFPDVATTALENGKTVIAIMVPGGSGLYSYDGRPYHRVGPTTSAMPQEMYQRRVMERWHAVHRWENEPAHERVSIADLDEEEIQRTVNNAVLLGRLDPPRERDAESILRGLGLIVDDRLINAAVTLYGKSRWLEIYYPQLSVRLARFRGINRLADFTDNRQYWGHAFDVLSRSEHFLLDHVPIAGRVVSGRMQREDRPLYPPRATREALANAICHRDYTMGGGAVAVAMYDDHLEITNPGFLPFGLTPEKLRVPHASHPWNPIIAMVFYRAGIIERWGTGTLNILQWCDENASPPPTWEEQAGSVVVTFLPAAAFETTKGGRTEQVNEQVNEQVTEQVLSRVLRFVQEPRTASEIQELVGLRHRPTFIYNYLRPMIEMGYLAMTIPDKPTSRLQRYVTTEKGRAWLQAAE